METNYSVRLRDWRARFGLSLEAAALRLGVSKETYRRWELGKRSPQSLAALAAVKRELAA